MIYLDNAATSWPKPPEVMRAITDVMTQAGGNPGRGGHQLAIAAGNVLYEARETLADFFGCDDPFRVVLSSGITESINLILHGLLRRGDHVIISPMEHNAVMRPLNHLEHEGVSVSILPSGNDGRVSLDELPKLLQNHTKLIIICHESNVNGVIQPLKGIGEFARSHGLYLLADCAQSAGHLPLDIRADQIDFLAFTGHKGLMGPAGTGGVIFGERVDINKIEPLKQGGTGSHSDSYEQPAFLPDKFECGTPNTPGFGGLKAGIDWLKAQNIQMLNQKQENLTRMLIDGLSKNPRCKLICAEQPHNQGNVISVTFDGVDNGEAGRWLSEEKQIMSRIGLHCAPLAHHTLGTFPNGTIRLACSPFTSEQDIAQTIAACDQLCEHFPLIKGS